MAALPQQALTFNDVFEEGDDEPQQEQTVQHIRANSSIMPLKKILGKLALSVGPCARPQLVPANPCLELH